MPKKIFFSKKKMVPMATWDDSEASEDDSEEEQAHMALMGNIEAFDDESRSESGSESDLDPNEVFSNLTCSEVESCLTEILENTL